MPDRRASQPSRAVIGASMPLLLAGLVGCAPAGSTVATPPASTSPAPAAPTTGAPSLATSPTPVTTTAPRPSGTLAWPTTSGVEFLEARYFSSPPFAVPFTIEVTGPGWFSAHLHDDFFDLLRFDGVDHDGLPTRMLAFGDPRHIRGPDGDVPVDELTAAQAADVLEGAEFLTVTDREPVALLGLEGVRVDIRSAVPNTPVFGGPGGNFGLGPQLPVRLAILERDGGFFLVLVLANADDLDQAWEQAQGLLETVDFGP